MKKQKYRDSKVYTSKGVKNKKASGENQQMYNQELNPYIAMAWSCGSINNKQLL